MRITSLGRPALVGKALSFTHELSFLFFLYQYTADCWISLKFRSDFDHVTLDSYLVYFST